MTVAHAWIPSDSPVPPALDELLSGAVADWSRRWFVTDPLSVGPLTGGEGSDLDWQAVEDGLMLGLATAAPPRIGERVLGLSSDGRLPADGALIEAVAQEAIADLRQRLTALVDAPRNIASHAAPKSVSHTATIGDPRRPLLAIGLTPELFATLALGSLPPPSPPPLGSGEDALVRLPVTVGAAMGRCTLTVADFAALGVGDILILDRAVDRPVPLTMAGASLAHGRCTVIEGEPPHLKIVDPVA